MIACELTCTFGQSQLGVFVAKNVRGEAGCFSPVETAKMQYAKPVGIGYRARTLLQLLSSKGLMSSIRLGLTTV
jgi:hypothetical protein